MKNDNLVFLIDTIGTRYGKRPSEIIGIMDEIIAFDFDATIALKANKINRGELADGDDIFQKGKDSRDKIKMMKASIKNMPRR